MINFSEILWKPQQSGKGKRPSSSPAPAQVAESFESLTELGQIPVEEATITPESRIALVTDPRGSCADRFRFLRMRLRELKEVVNLRKLLVTSPMPQDGKSTLVLNLATALAEHGKRPVLVLEADLYHPSIAQRLGLQMRPGLAECLTDGVDPLMSLRRVEPLGWYLLQAGTARGNPTELLQSESLPGLLEHLSAYFEWILIDTPPVAPLTDAISLSRHADASLLVVRADRTTKTAAEEAISLIGPKHLLGVVLNGADGLNRTYSEYYGYYGKK